MSDVNDRGLVLAVSVGKSHLVTSKSPDLVEVDGGAMKLVSLQVEVSHTNLTEVTRVVFIEVDTVVMLTTGVTATTRVLAVLTDTTVTGRAMTALVTVMMKSSRLRKNNIT